MVSNSLCSYSNAKSWAFEEAKKIVSRLAKIKKDKVVLETGYGPSGLPHIGTFGEVFRTTMVMNAFNRLSDIPATLYVFSDDMDGFRKVPTNVPKQEMLSKYIDYPLTSVPDPFDKYGSFAEHNNAMLVRFLDSFNFKYEFKSSTQLYKSGVFNNCIKKILENFDEIMSIMLPSLREERQQSYSPILPISPVTHKVLQVHIDEINLDNYSIVYVNPETGTQEEVSVLDGNCKLQWKADWGMRWVALGVDYEMNGKDLIDSYKLSSKICRVIGGTPPENLTYELFLDEEAKKISKSKGNGLSIDEWLKYAPKESLAYYMFQAPKRAKRLYFDVIPGAMDEYIDALQKYHDNPSVDNPVFHIHDGNPPYYEGVLKFSLLLNLVQACNTADVSILMQFINKYLVNPPIVTCEFMAQLANYAIEYYKDFIANSRIPTKPTEQQVIVLEKLKTELQKLAEGTGAEAIQNVVFEVGKQYHPGDAKAWFKTLYNVLFGADSGPKMGSFISLYGIENTISLINERILFNPVASNKNIRYLSEGMTEYKDETSNTAKQGLASINNSEVR